jgi:hypothetical protein
MYELMDRGVTVIERETFESALQLGRRVLRRLGFGAYRAREATRRNSANITRPAWTAVYPFYKDREQYVSMAKRARDELNEDVRARPEAVRQGGRGRLGLNYPPWQAARRLRELVQGVGCQAWYRVRHESDRGPAHPTLWAGPAPSRGAGRSSVTLAASGGW